MGKKINFWLVLVVAIILGFFRINQVPPSLSWDEAAIGWNAKTIWEMHLDEFGTRWPISFRSFDDYKAPLYIYLTAPAVGILGSTELAVRLVSVLAGIVSVFLIWKLGGAVAALLLAVSPWHLLLARPAFEANLALMFILGGIWLWQWGLKKPIMLLFSAVSFAASLYSYQAPKIFVPIFVLGLIWIYRQELTKAKWWLAAAGLLAAVIVSPLVKDSLGTGSKRFAMTSVFSKSQENLPMTLVKNYLIHFSPQWLFISGGTTGRSQISQSGMLLLGELPLLVYGLIILWRRRRNQDSRLWLWCLLAAPLPAMIGFDVPHAIRAYQMLPALTMITAVGLNQLRKNKFLLYGLLAINFGYFFYHYLFSYPVQAARDWQFGYREAAAVAQKYEDRVDKVIITSYYGQPYIFTYWYQDRKPQSVFWGGMIKYLFRPIRFSGDEFLENSLLIGSPEDIPQGSKGIIKEIFFPDGSVAFRVVKT